MSESLATAPSYKKIFDPAPTTEVAGIRRPLIYCWKHDVVLTLNVALATRRALLLKGEPGIGKSTIAEAAATALNWRFYRHVVTSRTEAQDLTWRFDYVRRLADAQSSQRTGRDGTDLDHSEYLIPGPFWWAFNPTAASRKGQVTDNAPEIPDPFAANAQRHPQGAVVLIDEIDKADPAVANDLLETLGAGRFRVDGIHKPFDVEWSPVAGGGQSERAIDGGLLVVFTSNDERDLPEAFMRRCVVKEMRWAQSSDMERAEFDQFLGEVARENWLRMTDAEPVDPNRNVSMKMRHRGVEFSVAREALGSRLSLRPAG
ncbi:MoxR family ATPase [uncultured Thiodictyon sp.]|uniref:AAA family ATPase n=1 Tax=uncultured Thiodictyon sp. TaxID=1846217 RepID=UPI0025EA6F4D|nr:MoxR family ATPase [uncultured Thiodictyon sp.]